MNGGLQNLNFWLERQAPQILPLIARLCFVASLGPFFWRSALTKLDGFGLSAGAYAQILPRLAEAKGYDIAAMPLWADGIVALGTITEFLLPAMILLGLFTRFSALAMTGFIVVMSLTDIFGHGTLAAATLQPRLMWFAVLSVLACLGGGLLSIDKLLQRTRAASDIILI
ncbi:DoxX family protein [Paracoccus aerodenitrificans]|uniref:DoxX family protein n=1 Tax=Paracoccus aerodenitrificans TaxID=3017781 RepID=UPI0022F0A5BD|nr:DoxX family membrane protein [Paracoccus aerodenitrificans]WBU64936.1 DoxX family membrane protein [Paracoccus aerodenitrificans]